MIERYTPENLNAGCDAVARRDAHLKHIIDVYGYPPLWVRPNSFATLVLIILEQQVSLASAYAAFQKLLQKCGTVTPETIVNLTAEELRACYFSRQKIGYVRGLAAAILANQINLDALYNEEDDVVRTQLKSLKGIGDWTVDIYLIHALQRTDVFPLGDLALVNGLRQVKALPPSTPKESLLALADDWRPLRTFATLITWHYYLQLRGVKTVY